MGYQNGTNLLLTGWTVSAMHHEPFKTQLPMPATGRLGAFYLSSYSGVVSTGSTGSVKPVNS